jgi:ankyrin repeat protein
LVNNKADENGLNELHIACSFGRFNVSKALVKRGIDPKIQNNNGATSLMFSAHKGSTSLCRWLVEDCNVDINKIHRGKMTALDCAV